MYAMFLFGTFGCEEEIYHVENDERYYTIINKTGHDVKIEISLDANRFDTISLASQDSTSRKGVPMDNHRQGPFDAYSFVHLVFDDSVYYLCNSVKHGLGYVEMIFEPNNYECVQDGPDVYRYRYEITEKEYEYAKAHPYKLNKEEVLEKRIANYRIVNGTKHDIRIELNYGGGTDETINLAAQDSITCPSKAVSYVYSLPFVSLWTHLVFDDSLYYLCDALNHERGYAEMIIEPNNYELISAAQDSSLYRYEITEKDYEYAKAHPYKYE
jgi:hypothetical protein